MKVTKITGLYNRRGIMCDDGFVKKVWLDMLELFDIEDLRDPVVSLDVLYDGWFEVEVRDLAVHGRDYYVFRVKPIDDENDHTVIEGCLCGEAHIKHADWETLIKELELGEE